VIIFSPQLEMGVEEIQFSEITTICKYISENILCAFGKRGV
jgi:hypothetical protein